MNSAAKAIRSTSNPRAPLALAAVAFGTGVWLSGHLHRPAWLWITAVVLFIACAAAAAAVRSTRLGYVSAIGALICVGAVSRLWMPAPQLGFPPDRFLTGAQVEIIGHVTDDGALLAGSEPRERFDLETEIIQIGDLKFTQPVGMRASIFLKHPSADEQNTEAEGGFPQVVYGNRVKLTGKLRPPRNFRNLKHSTMKAICTPWELPRWPQCAPIARKFCLDLPEHAWASGAAGFAAAFSNTCTIKNCGAKKTRRCLPPWSWAMTRFCCATSARSSRKPASITCWLSPG